MGYKCEVLWCRILIYLCIFVKFFKINSLLLIFIFINKIYFLNFDFVEKICSVFLKNRVFNAYTYNFTSKVSVICFHTGNVWKSVKKSKTKKSFIPYLTFFPPLIHTMIHYILNDIQYTFYYYFLFISVCRQIP